MLKSCDIAKKILIIGGESAGKTTLTENLIHHFRNKGYHAKFLHEHGRHICEKAGGVDHMDEDDYIEILCRTYMDINALEKESEILVVDTDFITTKFYAGLSNLSDRNKRDISSLADYFSQKMRYDLVIILGISGIIYVQDGLRLEKIRRKRKVYHQELCELHQHYFDKFKTVFVNETDWKKRTDQAIEEIGNLMG